EGRPVDELRALVQVLGVRRFNDFGRLQTLEHDAFVAAWPDVRNGHAADWERSPTGGVEWHRKMLEECGDPSAGTSPLFALALSSATRLTRAFAAVWHLDRLIAAHPQKLQHIGKRGDAYADLGRWEQAVADYPRAIDGKLTGLLPSRGHALAELGRWAEAAADFERALKIGGRLVSPPWAMGTSLPKSLALA